MKDTVEKLIKLNKTISTMESCTGGAVANAITDIEGASEILKFSAVTYSNEFKIKMGVDKKIIDKFSVYSIETATEMSKNICMFTKSDYGIGITGKLNRIDKNNLYADNNKIYISIYQKHNEKYYSYEIIATKQNRIENKELIIDFINKQLCKILDESS